MPRQFQRRPIRMTNNTKLGRVTPCAPARQVSLRPVAAVHSRQLRFAWVVALLLVGFGLPSVHAALIQYLDATNAASITTNASGTVTAWNDLSGNGNCATCGGAVSGTPKWPSTSLSTTGLRGVDMGATNHGFRVWTTAAQDSWLDFTKPQGSGGAQGKSGFAVLVAFKVDGDPVSPSTRNIVLGNNGNPGGANSFVLKYETGYPGLYLNNGANPTQYINNAPTAALAAGDTVVFAFNYDATNGVWELWDSNSGTEMSNTAAAGDFSSTQTLWFGRTDNGAQFMNGMIGEVRVFDSVLSDVQFQAEREAMAVKWADYVEPVAVHWRVRPQNPSFPTSDEVVIAVSLADAGFANPLPPDPATQDCTATFQEALSVVSAGGGGVVFVPAGFYRLDGTLTIPSRVTLRGEWKTPVAGHPITGTVLKVYAGQNDENGPPFIGLSASSAVKDLAFWYPDQLPGAIVPYAPTIQRVDNGANHSAENITLVNSYVGFTTYREGIGGRPMARNIYGTPLKTGIILDCLADVGRVENVNFSPAYWAGSGLTNAPTAGQHEAWIYNHGTGVLVGRIDWSYFSFVTVAGYNVGLSLRRSPYDGSDPNGQYYDFRLTNCNTGVFVDYSNYGSLLSRFDIQGAVNGIQMSTNAADSVTLHTCTVNATANALLNEGTAPVSFLRGNFQQGKLYAKKGYLTVIDSDFSSPAGTHIQMDSGVLGGSILGNRFTRSPVIVETTARTVAIDHAPVVATPMPVYDFRQPTNAYKPAKTNLYVVTAAPYNAAANGVTDDTSAFLTALTAAGTNGGGIVLVPGGDYRLNGTLTVPTGVELRGVFETPPSTANRGSVLNVYSGQNQSNGTPFIQIQTNAGIRGLTFHYPEQIYDANDTNTAGFVPYPFLIRSLGADVYVINSCSTITYQLMDLKTFRSDRHYVDGIYAAPFKTGFDVGGGSAGGQIRSCHIMPSAYRFATGAYASIPSTTITATLADVFKQNSSMYVFGNVTNQVLHHDFTFGGFRGVTLYKQGGVGPSGYCLGMGADACTTALRINGVGPGGFDFINSQLVSTLPANGRFIETDSAFTDTFRLHNTACWGGPQKSVVVNAGQLEFQLVLIDQAANPIYDVNGTGSLSVIGGDVKNSLTTYHQVEPTATAAFIGNMMTIATAGMPKSSAQITAFGNICRSETTPTPPAKPTGLVASPSGSAIQLDWANNAESDLNIYTVLRSTNSGSGFQPLASRLKSSDYLDTNTVGGVTYYYQVKALDTCSSESVASTNASTTIAVVVAPTPLQHLDASVGASVLRNGAGVVTNWLDVSGNGTDTANAGAIIGTPQFPSTSLSASGLPGVNTGTNRNGFRVWSSAAQDSWLDFTGAAAGNSGFAVLVVFKVDADPVNATSRNIVLANQGNPGVTNSFVLKYETGYPACYLGSGTSNPQYINNAPAAALQAGDTVVFAFNYVAASGAWQLWDSKSGTTLSNTAAANGNFSSAQTMYLGTSENSAQFMNGMIGEVKIFNTALDAGTFISERTALKTRWVDIPPVPAPTNLTYAVSAGQLILQWPNGQGWHLQSQTNNLNVGLNPASNAWFYVTATSPYTNSLSLTTPAVFFRLRAGQ